ncbi:hypothetical protein ACHQM5_013805 [Ranunculus cassubicifolius]
MVRLNIFLFMVIFVYNSVETLDALNSTIFLPINEPVTWTTKQGFVSPPIHFGDFDGHFILYEENENDFGVFTSTGFGCGFLCNLEDAFSCYWVIAIVQVSNRSILGTPPQIVWSANQAKPVGENGSVTISANGDMILADGDGNALWSSNTSGTPITKMSLMKNGNLVLFSIANSIVWQSFEHPTDTLVVGQTMRKDQRLQASFKSGKSSQDFYLSLDHTKVSTYVEGERSTRYLTISPPYMEISEIGYLDNITFQEQNISFSYTGMRKPLPASWLIPVVTATQILRLDADGGLRVYALTADGGWKVVFVFLGGLDECQFPLKCGPYGVCKDGQCLCPKGVDGLDYFSPINDQFPNMGCSLIGKSSSTAYDHYELVDFGQLSYFSYFDYEAAVADITTEEDCKQHCSNTSSCAAAFFSYYANQSDGVCYLPSQVLSLIGNPHAFSASNSSSYLKVYSRSSPQSFPRSSWLVFKFKIVILVITLVAVALSLVLLIKRYMFRRVKLLDLTSESPLSFSYHDLSIATGKFSKKLGGGGFGTVFKGILNDGTLIAVKRLDSVGQGSKEFLAEVETIGKIHHINLVRLVGYCVEKSHRLLVYEYMSNGSLDKWIFKGDKDRVLSWNMKCKIMLDVAKALVYLHEECRQQIIHLDVKPYNILIDDGFNAKLSDFGLSKLIDRDQSQVITDLRGTLGYVAPDWQHLCISVKADIYSFGIVLMEVATGRKILDYSRAESEVHLLRFLHKMAKDDRLLEIVQKHSEDMENYEEEAVKMIRLGLWCSDGDHTKRPLMSTVVKVLEGTIELNPNEISYSMCHVIPPLTSSSTSFPPFSGATVISIPR